MKNSIPLKIKFSGYGHYKVVTWHYGKEIYCTTDNMGAIDDYKSEDRIRNNRGYKTLRKECIRKNSKIVR